MKADTQHTSVPLHLLGVSLYVSHLRRLYLRGSCSLEINSNRLVPSQMATEECAHLSHTFSAGTALVVAEA